MSDLLSMVNLYLAGKSLPEVSVACGVPTSTVRGRLLGAGVTLRTRTQGIQLAGPRLSSSRLGIKRGPLSDETRAKVSAARNAWAAKHAKGTRVNSNGYVEYTRGPHKGRSVHDVMMEARLGRRLLPDEEVHHIDENRQHNEIDNFALLTKAAHMRLHRLLDAARGIERKRQNGRFA